MSSKPYTLIKSALLDVTDYVHSGIEIEDIEDTITNILVTEKHKAVCRPIPSLLAYEIKTAFSDDKSVCDILDHIVNELDILMVKTKEDLFMKEN